MCRAGREKGRGIGDAEERKFHFLFAFEKSVEVRTGSHQSGRDRGDVNPILCQLCTHSLGKADESELARDVRQQMRNRHFTADGRDIDNPAMALTFHQRNNFLHEIKRAPKMDRHRASVVFEIHMLRRSDLNRAGVVDQNINGSEFANNRSHAAPDFLLPAHVARQR